MDPNDTSRVLCDVLQLSLVPLPKSPRPSPVTYLPELASDQTLLTLDVLDLALLERIQMPFPPERTPFDYLVASFENASKLDDKGLAETLAKRLASFSVITLTSEILTGTSRDKSLQTFVRLLGADPKRNRALPAGFVKVMIDDDADEATTNTLFSSVLHVISTQVGTATKIEDVVVPLRALRHILDAHGAAEYFVQSPYFKVGVVTRCPI